MYKISIIIILLIVGCKTQQESKLLPTTKLEYNFNYKLQPNSTYIIKSTSENHSSSEMKGDPGEEITKQMAFIMEGDNHVYMTEQVRFVTGDLKNGILPLTINCDSIINEYDSEMLDKAMAMSNFNFQKTIDATLKTTSFAHSIDQKNIKVDSTDFKNDEITYNTKLNKYEQRTPTNFMSQSLTNSWSAQEKYPFGLIAIGDTFIHSELPYVYKPSKRDTIKTKRVLSPEAQKARDELNKMREGLKNAITEDKHFYIFEKVEGTIAYFRIIHKSSSSMMDISSSKGEGTGYLEYDLEGHFYRKIQTETSVEISTKLEEAVSISKGDYFKKITVELIK